MSEKCYSRSGPTPMWWIESKDGNIWAREFFNAHYSRRKYKDGRSPLLFVGPGQKVVLIGMFIPALFVWRKFINRDPQEGVNCSVFRNESHILSSTLIREAVEIAHRKWPGERLYTYVNPKKIRSTNPGACFQKAGWRKCGTTKGGLVVLEYKTGMEAKDNARIHRLQPCRAAVPDLPDAGKQAYGPVAD